MVGLILIAGFIVVLFSTVIFSLNPARQQEVDNNERRIDDVIIIANALNFYIYVNKGKLPPDLSIVNQEISSTGVDLCKLLVPDYLFTLPKDPSLNSQEVDESCVKGYKTNYFIVLNSDNTFTVSAPYTAIPPADSVIFKKNKIFIKKNIIE